MIRIRRWAESSANDRAILASVLGIYERAFPYYPNYSAKIAKLVTGRHTYPCEVFLLVAEGHKGRVLGFSLFFLFAKERFAYLDYIASDPIRASRGIGAALYEATREWVLKRNIKILVFDVPPDDPDLLEDHSRLAINKKRLAFYEGFGARPIINTFYERVSTKANEGYPTYLVFDPLSPETLLHKAQLKRIITELLKLKGNLSIKDKKVKDILKSIEDDPVNVRQPKYASKPPQAKSWSVIDLVDVGDTHQIHHLHEKGYVERPARIAALKKGLEGFSVQIHKTKKFPVKHIYEVHSKEMVHYIEHASKALSAGAILYPTVFPLRRPERQPKTWDMKAGYFCIDTFTPLTSNVFAAAMQSAWGALTGADLLLHGSAIVYSLCRPPGHHAERTVYGGFCYLNNAAIAAQYLSKHGRIAFLDIDYHHGNGSQEIFYKRSDIYFISIHGHPSQAYPYFSGFADELGEGEGLHFNRNFPLYPDTDDKKYLSTLGKACKLIETFKPDYLVISLGLDLMKGDPTGTFLVSLKGIELIGHRLGQLRLPSLIVQEGGYSRSNLRQGISKFFKGFLTA
ncbi:MAG: histone deacetylase family protein [Deltaproteobacteria bacterium]|nr:histone deacetylase family protein [Deltaproteobacteria bacterium]